MATLVGLALLVPSALNAWVVDSTAAHIVSQSSLLPPDRVALVLGTSPYLKNGQHNAFFTERVFAAVRLYDTGRVRRLLVSGANPSARYNEPRRMYQGLRAWGVRGRVITLDFAGFRTLDSIVRARRIFGLSRLIVVTQKFHAYRALFLARRSGVDAVAFVPSRGRRSQTFSVALREYFARLKAVLDVYVFGTEPRYLGTARPIGPAPLEPMSLRYLLFSGAGSS